MKALVFSYQLPRLAFAMFAGKLFPQVFFAPLGPTRYTDIPEPTLPAPDWCIVRVALCGICGSDTKQIFLDAEFDNPLSTIISFPNVPGHEVVGVIEQVGPEVKHRKVGERVALNPWLTCATRGIDPPCPNCQKGYLFNCQNFLNGSLPPGMHHGNCSRVTGGYAALTPAHELQLFPIPDEVPFDQAVLADPFSVSLHETQSTSQTRGDSSCLRLRHARHPGAFHPARLVPRHACGRHSSPFLARKNRP